MHFRLLPKISFFRPSRSAAPIKPKLSSSTSPQTPQTHNSLSPSPGRSCEPLAALKPSAASTQPEIDATQYGHKAASLAECANVLKKAGVLGDGKVLIPEFHGIAHNTVLQHLKKHYVRVDATAKTRSWAEDIAQLNHTLKKSDALTPQAKQHLMHM